MALRLHQLFVATSSSGASFRSNCGKCCVSIQSRRFVGVRSEKSEDAVKRGDQQRKLSEQSSWEAKDAEGNDYLYRLGKEADNMNIAVGARAGVIDDLFTGQFLGRDSDIVFDYRQKVTRSFQYLQGDYYIAPLFMDKVVCHIVKNYLSDVLNTRVPLILGKNFIMDSFSLILFAQNYTNKLFSASCALGIWGGKGQGKSFQTELIFQAMGVEPVIMSAGELESERAGEPGKLIRERYRTASQVVQNQGKMSCLMINDIDAGLGRFGNTQMTVNNQIVVGTLMQPNQEDIVNIVYRMYEKDGISRDEVINIVKTFPNQALDFYGALRSRTYDRSILKWVEENGGMKTLGGKLIKRKKDEQLHVYIPPKQTIEALLESGNSLIEEQRLIMETKLSKEYMKNMDD
ncbi:unnamed protein product [Rhodiola kirilowii]